MFKYLGRLYYGLQTLKPLETGSAMAFQLPPRIERDNCSRLPFTHRHSHDDTRPSQRLTQIDFQICSITAGTRLLKELKIKFYYLSIYYSVYVIWAFYYPSNKTG